jgi:DNA polymerase elongation subunit (family B)
MPEKLVEDPEVICDNFISIAPKMYFARKWWDEGLTLTKPKLKVTGLSMVRASTPKFFRQELSKVMEILIDGDLPKVIDFMEKVRLETEDQKPGQICINQGVSSLDYQWQESDKKFKKWVKEKSKWLSAPVNSRASLIHNKYIADKGINEIKDIEAGDKIGFLYMKEPNITGSNAFAFNNEKVFDYGLANFIDRATMFEKGFEKSIKLITDPIGWDLTPLENQIDEDEW